MPRRHASRPVPQDLIAKGASRPHSVRFNGVFEQRLRAAAAHEGVSVSEFIRQAVEARTDHVLGAASLWDRIEPIVEMIDATGRVSDTASRTHTAFAELAAEAHAEKTLRWQLEDEA